MELQGQWGKSGRCGEQRVEPERRRLRGTSQTTLAPPGGIPRTTTGENRKPSPTMVPGTYIIGRESVGEVSSLSETMETPSGNELSRAPYTTSSGFFLT